LLLIRLTVCVWYLEPDNKKKIKGAGIGGGLKKGMQPELPKYVLHHQGTKSQHIVVSK
jgi:hypothetical protein